jgi:hypothetical protein
MTCSHRVRWYRLSAASCVGREIAFLTEELPTEAR